MAVPCIVTLDFAGGSGLDGLFCTSLPVTFASHAQQRRASRSDHFAIRRPAEGNVMIELLDQQKKLTTNQWKLICTANLADLLDFFDFFLIGYVTAALTKQWSLTYLEGGGILLASGLGAVPGAFFAGWLGDRIGRRRVFIMSAVTISLATGLMA